MRKYFKVYTQKMASRLLSCGFPIQKVEPDAKHDGYNIFLFNDSEQIRNKVKDTQDEFRREKERSSVM